MKIGISGYLKFKVSDVKVEYTYEELEKIARFILSLEDELREKISWFNFSDKYKNPDTWLGDPDFKDHPNDPDEWTVSMCLFNFIEHIYKKKIDEIKLKYGNHDISDKILKLYIEKFGIIDEEKIIADSEYSCCYFHFKNKDECSRFLNWSYELYIKPAVNEWKKQLKYEEMKMT